MAIQTETSLPPKIAAKVQRVAETVRKDAAGIANAAMVENVGDIFVALTGVLNGLLPVVSHNIALQIYFSDSDAEELIASMQEALARATRDALVIVRKDFAAHAAKCGKGEVRH